MIYVNNERVLAKNSQWHLLFGWNGLGSQIHKFLEYLNNDMFIHLFIFADILLFQ